ncbi:MAG: cystathionine beta-lyase [Flavobacteriales bacterium]|nr:MAG: cystathionine beta-lyase [Flavobacteriales bacterium]
MDISEILNHLGEDREKYFKAVTPPVMQSSIFCFNSVAEMREGLKKEFVTPFYTRGHNPTVAILRQKLAALEGSEDALIFASGSAAVAAAIMSSVKSGDHVICIEKPYSWTNKLLNNYLVNYNVKTTMIDGTKLENFEKAIQSNTKLIYLESPNSHTFELQDIAGVCKLAKSKNITTICDNSYSTPLFQQPIALGVDMVVHSASKYLNGHSDVVAGVLCASKERINKIFASEFMTIGGIISPHDAWLMLRGLRTLHLRVNRSAESTEKVVEFLENHPKVEKVFWPFLKHHPQYELAKKQMCKCGGMFSVLLETEKIEEVEQFCDSLKRFLLACSWGGHESLVFPIAALYDSQNYDNSELPLNLVRIYIGLEDPEVLIEDLSNALATI